MCEKHDLFEMCIRDSPSALALQQKARGHSPQRGAPLGRQTAVSYTHLDVYKRQAHSHPGKNALQIASRINIISSKTGEIFYRHTVCPPRLQIPHHAEKRRAFKIRPRIPVVYIRFTDLQIFPLPAEPLQQLPLICYAVTLFFVSILLRQPDIKRRPVNFSCSFSRLACIYCNFIRHIF